MNDDLPAERFDKRPDHKHRSPTPEVCVGEMLFDLAQGRGFSMEICTDVTCPVPQFAAYFVEGLRCP